MRIAFTIFALGFAIFLVWLWIFIRHAPWKQDGK